MNTTTDLAAEVRTNCLVNFTATIPPFPTLTRDLSSFILGELLKEFSIEFRINYPQELDTNIRLHRTTRAPLYCLRTILVVLIKISGL